MGIILNPFDNIRIGVSIHLIFLFSVFLILLLCSDILVLRFCVDPMYIYLHLLHSILHIMFFE